MKYEWTPEDDYTPTGPFQSSVEPIRRPKYKARKRRGGER